MIDKDAIANWITRRLMNSTKAKGYSRSELLSKIGDLDPPPKFVTEPQIQQLVCFLFTVYFSGFNIWLDPGGGKTKVLLDAIRYRKITGEVKRALVLVPMTSNLYEWEDEIHKHQPSLGYEIIDGPAAERERKFWHGKRIVLCTYAGLMQMVCETVNVHTRKGSVRKWAPVRVKMEQLVRTFRFLGMDETSVYCRSHDSLTFKILRWFVLSGAFCYGLTGTPMNNNPEDFWAQFFLVDGGDTLGDHITLFREAFFTLRKKYWGWGMEHVFDKTKETVLHNMMRHRSIYYKDEEMTDLPPAMGGIFAQKVPLIRYVIFTDEIWAYYERLISELTEAKGNFTAVESAYLRMRQVCAGYLTVKDPEGERISVKFKNNPKLEVLMQLIHELPKDEKILVFCIYRLTAELLVERLQKEKVGPVGLLYGGTSGKRRRDILRGFKSGSTRLLVANEAGAYGLNFQGSCRYMIMFETPSAPIVRKQMEKRLWRQGQKRRVWIWDLVVKASIEEKILKALQHGRDLFVSLVEGKNRKKRKIKREIL